MIPPPRYLVPEKNIPAYKLGNLLIESLEIRLFTLDKYIYESPRDSTAFISA